MTTTAVKATKPIKKGEVYDLDSGSYIDLTGKGGLASSSAASWTSVLWAETVLTLDGLPVTANNVGNLLRMVQGEVGGQDGGFLRDNNPLNYDTWASPHSPSATAAKYGGKVVYEYGVYIMKFPTPWAGAEATAAALREPGNAAMLKALKNDAPTTMFGAALASSEWAGAGYASAKGILNYTPLGFPGAPVYGGGFAGAKKVTGGYQGPTGPSAAGVAIPGTGGWKSFLPSEFSWLGDLNWSRAGIFLGGAALTITGMVLFYKSTSSGTPRSVNLGLFA